MSKYRPYSTVNAEDGMFVLLLFVACGNDRYLYSPVEQDDVTADTATEAPLECGDPAIVVRPDVVEFFVLANPWEEQIDVHEDVQSVETFHTCNRALQLVLTATHGENGRFSITAADANAPLAANDSVSPTITYTTHDGAPLVGYDHGTLTVTAFDGEEPVAHAEAALDVFFISIP